MAGLMDGQINGGFTFQTSPLNFSGGTVQSPNGGTAIDLPLAAVASFAQAALDFSGNNSNANRAFFSGVVNQTQGAVSNTAQQSFQYQQGTLDLFKSINSDVGQTVRSSGKSGWCFITTAICREMGRDDDCEELTALRAFRDGYLQRTSEGPELIAEYYRIAPAIVEGIDKRPDAREVYRLMAGLHLRCVLSCIALGMPDSAILAYRKMVEFAKEKAGV